MRSLGTSAKNKRAGEIHASRETRMTHDEKGPCTLSLARRVYFARFLIFRRNNELKTTRSLLEFRIVLLAKK